MKNQMQNSSSPVLVVTGASSGIGAATAVLFAQKGYRVCLAARRIERLQALVESIHEHGGQAMAIQTDVTRLDSMKNLFNETINQWGKIDVLFNNAGFGRLDWVEKLDEIEDIQSQIDVNLTGLIWGAHAVLPAMIARRQGHIINMASLASYLAPPTYSIYAATKFAVRGFSEGLRREVGVYNIRVSAIYPGIVKTEFDQHTGAIRKTGWSMPDFLTLSSEQVAEAVYNLVIHPKRNYVIPWSMLLAIWGNKLFPGFADKMIEWFFVRHERQM